MENALQPERNPREMIAAGKEAGLHLKKPEAGRYSWRWVNFSLFLYDEKEDLHIPESVYRALRKG
jgi:hypothetical protein